MKLRIVALGVRMPAWVDAAFDDYARRMPREFALELIEVKPEPRGRGRSVPQILAAEARAWNTGNHAHPEVCMHTISKLQRYKCIVVHLRAEAPFL